MKILHVIPTMETGGAQKLLLDLLELWKKEDHEIKLVIFKKTNAKFEKEIEEKGIDIEYINTGTRSLNSILKLRKYLKWTDVAHAHLFPTNYFMALANKGINKPIFYTEHSTHNKRRNHKFLRPLETFIYRQFTKIICISEATKNNLNVWLQDKKTSQNIIVIENGVALDRFEKAETKNPVDIYGKEGWPIIMISRFDSAKDQATLVKSLPYISGAGKAFVVLVGDGPTKTNIEKLAQDLGVAGKVIFLGFRNDIPQLIKASKIGVQSSNWEGFGLTAVEMMAGGLPVIASDVEGLKEVVEPYGLLFRHKDYQDLALKINSLIENSHLYEDLKNKSKVGASKYSIRTMADKYMEIYKQKSF